jgi:hypothetical protein
MYLKCLVKKISSGRKTNISTVWSSNARQNDILKNELFILELCIEENKCFIKQENQWQYLNQQQSFTFDSHAITFEIMRADSSHQHPSSLSLFPTHSMSHSLQSEDRLAFLYDNVNPEFYQRQENLEISAEQSSSVLYDNSQILSSPTHTTLTSQNTFIEKKLQKPSFSSFRKFLRKDT